MGAMNLGCLLQLLELLSKLGTCPFYTKDACPLLAQRVNLCHKLQ